MDQGIRLDQKTSQKTNKLLTDTGSTLLLVILLGFLLLPFYWMISTSLKDDSVIFLLPPEWIPKSPTLKNFKELFAENYFITYYKNSFIVSTGATLASMVTAMFAGYAFSRFTFKFKNQFLMLILSSQMFPVISLLIALYGMYSKYHLLNTRLGLIIATTTASLPFCIIMIKGFFDEIPIALEEAARIDGASRFGILFRVIFPLSKPGFLAVGIYTFLLAWDDLLYALTLVNKDEIRTLPTGISIRYLGELSYDWSAVMTVSVVATLPILILFLFLQKYMIAGLTAGAVKG